MSDTGTGRSLSNGGTMTLMEHLVELRSRLIKSVLAVVVGAVVCWILYPQILDLLVQPYCDVVPEEAVDEEAARQNLFGGCELLVLDPLEPFSVRLTVAGYGGLALAIPVVLWQVWRFVQPGLYRSERRHAIAFTVVGALLFALGAGLAYWSIPRALKFLSTIGGEDLVTGFSPGQIPVVRDQDDGRVRHRLRIPHLAGVLADGRDHPLPAADPRPAVCHRRHRGPGGGDHPQRRPVHADGSVGADVPVL